ncbi:MAG TPA: hypothetical protein DCE41_12860 [Cytophagales bacterium]|nr:hypothetical protein [Cytophagales bacterium]HAA21533.1 hypothetical protein [Cytophagales bacterium]HAP64061.1 hypothetical protein [Cytophagales bacterium]
MKLELDEDLMAKVGASPQDVLTELAVTYYKQEKLSLGQASSLARLDRIAFLSALAARNLTVNYTEEDLEEDLENLAAYRQADL